ncbi:uncharacterized protein Triagg1_4159 [Trichoderma aggressivum f. europaeum]|uniref:NmrA-like domain-containing protein n=1 Tax=Trichoderma aggressivum f. europaeum TaxID=173218 RepID=A0AAE1M5Z8_9HYPO|nr:hypothetical protein Triagg1_4159 [Trichoderma aggressivum f. europaeum]
MATKKNIAVLGSTGNQGGSVAKIFLSDPKLKKDWTVRAITRDVTKASAKKLESQGAELVAADINDGKSLAKAFSGAAAIFAVTNYWDTMSKEREEQQGRTIVDAAKDARVQHFIYSSLIDVAKATNGKLLNVYHFDSKAVVEQYARDAGIPATFFQPGFFMSNIPGQLLAQESPEKPWTLAVPTPETAPFPMFDAEADTGKFVKAIILKRDEVLGKRVLGATAYQTPAEILVDFKSAFPNASKDAKFFSLPHEMFTATLKGQGMPDFAAEELLQNFRLMDEGGYYAGEKLDWSLSILEDKPTTWLEHLKAAKAFQGLN